MKMGMLILIALCGLVAGVMVWSYRASAGPVQVRLGTESEIDKRLEAGVEDPSQLATCTPLSLSFYLPALSGTPIAVKSSSLRTPGATYSVNLAAQTCTCDDFKTYRAGRPVNHSYRWCRHLMAQYGAAGAFEGATPWLYVLAGLDEGGPRSAFVVQRPGRQDVLVAVVHKPSEWFDVYAPASKRKGEKATQASGPIERFGWSLERHEWAHGEAPPGARELRRILGILEKMRFKVF